MKRILSLLFISSSLFSMQSDIVKKNHQKYDKFHVLKINKLRFNPSILMPVNNISKKQMLRYVQRSSVGNGVILGTAAYWTTKIVCYGVMLGGIRYVIGKNQTVNVGPAVIPVPDPISDLAAEGIKNGLAHIAKNTAVSVVVDPSTYAHLTSYSAPAIDTVSKVIINSDLGYEATMVTAIGINTATTAPYATAGVTGGIESLATAVGAFFTGLPTP